MLWRRMYRDLAIDAAAHTISFDVFDTLITRPWFHPFDQFAAIAPQLRQLGLCAMSDLEWLQLRLDSDRKARMRAFDEEISLKDIYAVIAERVGWTTSQAGQAYELELQQELRDIRPIANALKTMKQVRLAGKQVIVTSDTYFSSAELALLLQRCGYDLPPEDIFASADHRVTKVTGRLFSAILEKRQFRAHQLYHIGDQPVPDGRAPANLGIGSSLSSHYGPTRYERLLAEAKENDFLVWSAVAGCSRVSRLARSFDDSHSQAIWDTGCNVAGPLLFAYTLSVLYSARESRDKSDLLSRPRRRSIVRDCTPYLPVAGLADRLPLPIRIAAVLFIAALIEFNESGSDWFLNWWEVPVVRSILTDVAGGCHFPKDWDGALSLDDLKQLHRTLKDLGLSEKILAMAREQREVLIDYFLQEGMADGTRWALCDVGWRGTAQLCLAQITKGRPEFPQEFKGFYFGLNRKSLFIPVERTEAFYAGDAGFVSKLGWLVEAFCWAEHGSVEYFSRSASGSVEPILATPKDEDQIEWGSRTQRAAIMLFVDNLTRTLNSATVSVDRFVELFRKKALAAFELMRTRPTLDEAEAYGSMLIDYDLGHKRKLIAGPALRPDRLLLWLALRSRSGVARFWWPQGAVRRSVRSSWLRAIFHSVNDARVLWDRLRGRVAS